MIEKKYRKAFIRQRDQSDCGVACLASLIRYYGGNVSIERLRELSGTDKQGTSLLGLHQAANEIGLESDAFEGDIPHLKDLKDPSVLHVLLDGSMLHYIVCYGYFPESNGHGKFLISDPGSEVSFISEEELDKIWDSKALLIVKPGDEFKTDEKIKQEKWYWMKKLVKEDMNILGIALALGVAIAVLSMSTAVFSQKLIDDILPESNALKLGVGLSLLLFLLLVRSGFNYIRQFFLIRQSKDFNNRIIGHFYGSLLHLPKLFFDTRKVGELVARMNDTARIQGAVSYITTNLMIDVLLVLISAIFILTYSVTLGLIALLSIPFNFLIVYLFHNKIVTSQREVMASYARNESNYVDTIQGIEAIKISNKESIFTRITSSIYDFFQGKIFQLGKVSISFNFFTEILGTILFVVIISLSSLMVFNETLKLGQMMAILQMMGMLMPSAGRLAMTNIQLQEARVAFDRMFEFTSIYPEYDPEEDDRKTKISGFESLDLKEVSFRFPGQTRLLTNISFTLIKGEMISLLGESGCGKSTLLQIIQRFYKFEEGNIKVNGNTMKDISIQSWRQYLAVVPQEIKIFNGSLIDNICLGEVPGNKDELFEFFNDYGFNQYFEKFPQAYSTILGEEGVNISGGEQQLVALARALYKKPQLLLLDEATSSMDRNTEAFTMKLLQQLKTSIAVILVTHRVKTARNADRIYVIQDGTVHAEGDHEELMKGVNLYSESWKDYSI